MTVEEVYQLAVKLRDALPSTRIAPEERWEVEDQYDASDTLELILEAAGHGDLEGAILAEGITSYLGGWSVRSSDLVDSVEEVKRELERQTGSGHERQESRSEHLGAGHIACVLFWWLIQWMEDEESFE